MHSIIYIKTDEHVLTDKRIVCVGDVFQIEGTDEKLVNQVKSLRLYTFLPEREMKSGKQRIIIFSILKVIERIHTIDEKIEVVNLGEADFIVEYAAQKEKAKVVELVKLVGVCILTFLGSAFTIMAFHNDISISGVFEQFYLQVAGQEKPPVTELEIFYSIGLAIGITLFFNHIGKKKITSDPTPIQVELRKYESDMANTLIENAERKGHYEDVK